MAQQPDEQALQPKMDPTDLYREEIYTDRKVGTIRRLTPVKADGSTDSGRPVVYIGESQIMTSAGALPLSFEVKARSLEEAVKKYGDAAKQAFEHAMHELQELRRQAASSIVVPQAGGGGGKIQLP